MQTQEVVDRIDEMLVTHNVEIGNTSTSRDILSQALGTKDPPRVVKEFGEGRIIGPK